MAVILVAEVLQHERVKDWPKLKQAARMLRAGYAGLYREEDIFAPYAVAMRGSGNWVSAGNVMNDDWTWAGKAQGTPAPVEDENRRGRGFCLRPDKSIEFAAVRTHGATGASVDMSVGAAFTTFASGIKFDASAKDGRHRKLVIRDTGEVSLYEVQGQEEKRTATATLAKKLKPGEWVELAYVAEAGDLLCYVAGKPVFLVAATVPTDRDIGFWSGSADANFRFIQLRK